jgi:hypothetical protein
MSGLPSGKELMSSPVRQPGQPIMSRAEKERAFIMSNVSRRLEQLNFENYFYLAKSVTFTIGLLFAVGGIILIMRGLQLTPIFAAYPFSAELIIIGGAFMIPMLCWFGYVFLLPFCSRTVGDKRKKMREQRAERKNPSLFNDMVKRAEEDSKPKPKKIRIILGWRKHEFVVDAHTVQEMCDQIEYKIGLRPGQQLFKYKNDEVNLPLDKILEDDLGYKTNTKFDLYNRGGFVWDVKSSPEHRLAQVRQGNTDEDNESVLTRSIAKFRRDPYAALRQFEIADGANSVGDISSLGKDQSTIGDGGGGGKRSLNSVAEGKTGGGRKPWDHVEETKKSGFVSFIESNSRKVAAVDSDDVSQMTEPSFV